MPNDVSIGTVLVVAALWLLKEVATYCLKVMLERHRDTISRAINKRLWMVGFDLFALAYLVWAAFFLFNSTEPATKRDVLLACGWTLMFVISAVNFLDDLIQWARASRAQPMKPLRAPETETPA